jgi:uncharacterized protein (TIGR03118 family)
MNRIHRLSCIRLAAGLSLMCLTLLFGSGCGSGGGSGKYQQVNLVSDQGGATILDANLANAWGLALNPTAGGFWVANNHTDTATIYPGDVAGSPLTKSALVVSIPGGAPTGQVFNGTTDFKVTAGGATAPALFIFSSESGHITGWNPGVPPPAPSNSAQNGATVAGAVYKGLAIGVSGGNNYLYAANFNAGTIDVFDKDYVKVTLAGSFNDPNIPAGFAPFNIQNLGGRLFVTYAKQDGAKQDDVPGAGNGYVDIFDTTGHLIGNLISQGDLNSPWGLVLAPSTFGKFPSALLVGNFGDGKINAYDPNTGVHLGTLQDQNGNPIVISGLWGLITGNGVTAGDTSAVYFSAGPGGEQHGLFGKLVPVP